MFSIRFLWSSYPRILGEYGFEVERWAAKLYFANDVEIMTNQGFPDARFTKIYKVCLMEARQVL